VLPWILPDVCPGEAVLADEANQGLGPVRDRHVPHVVGIHQGGDVDRRDVLADAPGVERYVRYGGFDACYVGRCLNAERLECKLRLRAYLSAPGGDIFSRLGTIAELGVADDAADAVGVGLLVADDNDLVLSHALLGSPTGERLSPEVSSSAVKGFMPVPGRCGVTLK
jgi:hypothetical protein